MNIKLSLFLLYLFLMHRKKKKVDQACGFLMCSKVLRLRDMKSGLENAYGCVVGGMRGDVSTELHGGMMKMFYSYIMRRFVQLCEYTKNWGWRRLSG